MKRQGDALEFALFTADGIAAAHLSRNVSIVFLQQQDRLTEEVISGDFSADDDGSLCIHREQSPRLPRAWLDETQVNRAGVLSNQSLDDVLMVLDRSGPKRMISKVGLTDPPTFGMEVEGDTVIAAEEVVE
ncbi:MAG: hypothetical protein DI606_19725 [Sphingobium sp.]|nr:MAG: hypothetical protein DI606_19725 [Sphingobium sp.]